MINPLFLAAILINGLMTLLLEFLKPSVRIDDQFRQGVYISNILSLILSIFTFILFIIEFSVFGWTKIAPLILGVMIVFVLIVPLNRYNYNLGRMCFCLVPIYTTMAISLYAKVTERDPSYITYFDSRFLLLASSIMPALVFELKEKLKIGILLASSLLLLIFYDPIHHVLGLGYYQRGFNSPEYYYINYIVIISELVLISGSITLKAISEKAEHKVKDALNQFYVANEQLLERNAQLNVSKLAIEEANNIVSAQQNELEKLNYQLEKSLEEKSEDLGKTNEELVRKNNELEQFSFTVSHNLRAPVARLLGLSNLLTKSITTSEKNDIGYLIQKSTIELDAILTDLNQIIDIRNHLYRVREKILIEDELKKVMAMLQDQILAEFDITFDFSQAPYVYSIRPMINSILYNLVSNSIKYRNPENDLKVHVTSEKLKGNDILISVTDNGLGFNITSEKNNIFKLYRRYHTHVDGKGLGLFLVKTQLDSLGGRVDVDSTINVGTTFKVTLPTPEDVSKQIFFESDAALIYYDANINNTVIIWRKSITSEEYRNAFLSVMHTLKIYRTPGWIADLRLQGEVLDLDQVWFINTVIPEAVSYGLKRIAAVGFSDPVRKSYYDRMIEITAKKGLTLRVFESLDEAVIWMSEFIHKVH